MRTISDLHRYGYAEVDCLNHTIAWINYTVAFTTQQELVQLQLREKLHLRRTMLAGVFVHNPTEAMEMYENMMAALDDDDASDEAWLTGDHGETNLTALQPFLRKEAAHEQSH